MVEEAAAAAGVAWRRRRRVGRTRARPERGGRTGTEWREDPARGRRWGRGGGSTRARAASVAHGGGGGGGPAMAKECGGSA